MRPPQEATSLLVRATQGCSYNLCSFCYVSRGYAFESVSMDWFEAETLRQKPFFPEDTRIYLTGSNPFALPFSTLADFIAILRRHIPQFSELSLQSRIDDISRKTDTELVQLRDMGLTHLYIGVENGNDVCLKRMQKGYTALQAVHELQRLDAAHIAYTTFYMLGMGGAGTAEACGRDTAMLFNQVHPRRITTTGLTVFPQTPLARMVEEGLFQEASEREKIEELLIFLEALDVDTFYDGIHYLNPLNYRFSNHDQGEKTRILNDIREVLHEYSSEDLEKMVSRTFMQSL